MTSLNFRTNTYDTVTSTYQIRKSRRCCPFHSSGNSLFFSLVDYRNNYFTSDDPDKIIEFYNGFENRDQLIQWMKERPKGVANIREIDGDKDIIVVIPTADFNGKYAMECRENIFRGLHIIFVESAEIPDPYFNGAHNVNVGIKKALEYNPKWIVFSNDDMYMVDAPERLKNELFGLDPDKFDILFIEGSKYHSKIRYIGKITGLYKLYLRILPWINGQLLLSLHNKFKVRYHSISWRGIFSLTFSKIIRYRDFTDFLIVSINYSRSQEGYIFDEIYINSREDTDLSLRVVSENLKYRHIKYQIGDFIGSTMGNGLDRALRSYSSYTYFNWKWERYFEEYTSKERQ